MIQVQIVLGRALRVTVEGEDEKQVIREAAFFSAMPDECPICRAPVRFTHRRPQGKFEYFGLQCIGEVPHETTFGQRMEGGGLFYKEHEPWKPSPRGKEDY